MRNEKIRFLSAYWNLKPQKETILWKRLTEPTKVLPYLTNIWHRMVSFIIKGLSLPVIPIGMQSVWVI